MSDEVTPETTYKAFFEYDLALITLPNTDGFNINVNVAPICIWPYDQIPNLPTGKVSMTGYGQIRSTVPKHVWPGPYYFSNAGVAGLDSECKYIAMLPAQNSVLSGSLSVTNYSYFFKKCQISQQIKSFWRILF